MIKIVGKFLAGFLALVAVIAIGGIVAFKLLADPEKIKAEVIELVAEQTGRTLTIDGDLQLSFVPWIGFEVGKMSLNNEDGFGDDPFATMESAEARIRLLPLFSKKIEVGEVVIDGLRLDLVSDRTGRTNWDDFVADNGAESTGESPDESGGSFKAEGIASIAVRNANIRYRDLALRDEYALVDANITAGPLVPGEPFAVTAEFDFTVDDTLAIHVNGETTLISDLNAGVFTTGTVKSKLELTGSAIGAKPLPVDMTIESIVFDTNAETMNIDSIVARTLDTAIRTSLTGSNMFEDPVFRGPLVVDSFSPRTLMNALSIPVPDTADGSVLREARFTADMEKADDSIALQNLKGTLDDSQVSGRFALVSIDNNRMTFDLAIDALNADRYLPPAGASGTGGAAGEDQSPLPVEALKALDVNGTIRIGKLTAAGIQSTDVRATVKARNGDLRVNPSQAKLYGGQYSGDVRLTARGDTVSISMNEKVTDVQAGALMGDALDASRLSGAANVELRLNGSGKTLEAMRRTLSGDLVFRFDDGYIEGVDLWYEIRRAKALFGKASPPAASKPARTAYSDIRGTAVVKDGIVRSNDLAAVMPFLQLTGQGEINLVDATIDYRVNAVVLKKPEVTAEAQLADLVGARIPVRISGDLMSPSVAPDIGALVRAKAEDAVKEKLLGKVFGTSETPPGNAATDAAGESAETPPDTEEAIKQELESKVKDKLRGLFGGSRKEEETPEPASEDKGTDGGGGGD
ncbi:MAG: AsmA family protein [Gammaproteobacteria bacterium]|nr:AsmA family protein [Gammaproteobacteria bacterium]